MREHTEHEKIYYDANSQKDYIPLLKDPSTPEKMMEDIVDRISTLELKKLAMQHPNISQRSVRYILEKADKKPYQQELIEYTFNYTNITSVDYQRLKDYFNKAGRLQTLLNVAINSNKILPERMGIISTMLNLFDNNDLRIFQSILSNENCPKDAFESMFNSLKNPTTNMLWSLMVKSNASLWIKHHNFPHEKILPFFEETGMEWFLTDSAKDVFIF